MGKSAELWSLARSILEPTWRKDELHLFQMLPYGFVVSDEVMSTRNGGLLAAAEITGVNADTLTQEDFEYLTERFERVLRSTSQSISLYIHRLSIPAQTAPAGAAMNEFADAVSNTWDQEVGMMPLKTRKIILSAVLEQSRKDKVAQMFSSDAETIEEERAEQIEELDNFFATLRGTLGDTRVERLKLSEGNWLGYYGMLLNGNFQPIVHANDCEPIACNLTQEDVLFTGKAASVNTTLGEERSVRVYSLKNYPNASMPGIFDGLDMAVDVVLTQTFLPLSKASLVENIRVKRSQMRSANDAAKSLEEELGVFADGIASGDLSGGTHHMSIVMFGADEVLKKAEQHIIGEIQISGGTLKRERGSQRAVYFAQHPGNMALRTRQQTISDAVFADLTAFHMRPKGLPGDKLPWNAPLATFQTLQGEKFDLSIHLEKTSSDEEDLPSGHSLILGPTGSGKTVVAMFAAARAAAKGVRILAFDKDRAMEAPLRAMGARYHPVLTGQPTGMNPLQTETDEGGQGWLANWLHSILGHSSELTVEQSDEITKAAIANADLPSHLQNFDTLLERFKAFNDGKDLHLRCREWSRSGRLGWMFGQEGSDPFADNARHLAFDVSQIVDDPLVRMAWLSYVMRRLEIMAQERLPTMIIIDEAWLLLDSPYFANVITDWFTTMRKKNCAVILLTQLPAHILSSRAAASILGNTSTTMLFPSRKGEDEDYRKMGLNEAEIASLRAHFGDRVMLFKKADESVWLDVDLSGLGSHLRVLSGAGGKTFANKDWRETPNFWKEI